MKKLKPNWCLLSAYHASPQSLKQLGIKAVLVDLDNTLIAWDNPEGTSEMREWLSGLKSEGIQVVIVSNNTEKRVSKVAKQFNVLYVANAKKPTSIGLSKALRLTNHAASEVVMIGDQLLTDILGGNCIGVKTIFVKPLIDHDMIPTRINRSFEKIILKQLSKTADMSFKSLLE